jgi:hypothetical protein
MEEKIVVNVKGVQRSSWNALCRDAALRHEHYGVWLSDAIDQRLRTDAQGVASAISETLTTDQRTARIAALAELAKGLAALRAAGSRSVGVGALVGAVAGVFTGGKAQVGKGQSEWDLDAKAEENQMEYR